MHGISVFLKTVWCRYDTNFQINVCLVDSDIESLISNLESLISILLFKIPNFKMNLQGSYYWLHHWVYTKFENKISIFISVFILDKINGWKINFFLNLIEGWFTELNLSSLNCLSFTQLFKTFRSHLVLNKTINFVLNTQIFVKIVYRPLLQIWGEKMY